MAGFESDLFFVCVVCLDASAESLLMCIDPWRSKEACLLEGVVHFSIFVHGVFKAVPVSNSLVRVLSAEVYVVVRLLEL